MIIRPEQPEDFEAIADVVRDAFGDHGPAVARLVEDIRASDHYIPEFSLVAVDESGVIGHVMLSWTAVKGGARDRVLQRRTASQHERFGTRAGRVGSLEDGACYIRHGDGTLAFPAQRGPEQHAP